MNRRRFLRWAFVGPLALCWGAAAALQGCGSEDTTAYPAGSLTPPTCDGVGPDSMTGAHIHPVCISQALLDAPVDSVVTLEAGSAGHTHTISLTAADIVNIRDNVTDVMATSSVFVAHSHIVTFLA